MESRQIRGVPLNKSELLVSLSKLGAHLVVIVRKTFRGRTQEARKKHLLF